jgi:iron-sulfur cluster repair protein YtfE (RIC family)
VLVTLGARANTSEVVDLLASCHRKIRQHIVFARRLASEGAQHGVDEIRATAGQVRRYFAIALPLHIADEDQSIAPLLAELPEPVAGALATMAGDHERHQPLIDRLVELCAELERDPARLGALALDLGHVAAQLSIELSVHLELEEHVVFPAVRALPEAMRAELLLAMRGRREGSATD